MILGLLSLTAAGLFTGAAVYINVAEQPARLTLSDGPLLAEWKPAYKHGAAMQAPLALVGGLLGIAAWWLEGGEAVFLAGGVAMLANWPWTAAVIQPVNNQLMATDLEQAGPRTRELIRRWNALHMGRSALGAAACGLFAYGLHLQS